LAIVDLVEALLALPVVAEVAAWGAVDLVAVVAAAEEEVVVVAAVVDNKLTNRGGRNENELTI
jgi:hypothetical protein